MTVKTKVTGSVAILTSSDADADALVIDFTRIDLSLTPEKNDRLQFEIIDALLRTSKSNRVTLRPARTSPEQLFLPLTKTPLLVDVEADILDLSLTEREYGVILGMIYGNFREEPILPEPEPPTEEGAWVDVPVRARRARLLLLKEDPKEDPIGRAEFHNLFYHQTMLPDNTMTLDVSAIHVWITQVAGKAVHILSPLSKSPGETKELQPYTLRHPP